MERAMDKKKKKSKPKITRRCVIEEKTKELCEKPLHDSPS